jgi:hypothetical protein
MPEERVSFISIKDVPIEKWKILSEKKIFFGHKSVGYNIMEGLEEVLKEHPEIELNVRETSEASGLENGTFAHAAVGKNGDPKSKMNDFVNIIDNGVEQRVDFAGLKFCWADIMGEANVDQMFSDYVESMDQLTEQYPGMIFIHFTAPLTTNDTGPKKWIKRVLGKPIWGFEENIKRNQFNEKLINHYIGKEPVFDIAKIESTFPDGRRSSFIEAGKTCFTMVPEYTYDHGHLNETGRRKVAEQLLIFLADLV